MIYKSTIDLVNDLEKHGHLVRIKEEVDPNLEMAAIHLRVYEKGGPAILFENIKGCSFPAVSNLYGTKERSEFIFRTTFSKVQSLIKLKNNPIEAIKSPLKNLSVGLLARKALPKKLSKLPSYIKETSIDKLPLIKCWPNDGGAFITLPQVYSEDPEKSGIMNSNLGMYRVQLNGNDYELNKEVGIHYQIHRGIGVHHTKATKNNNPLKVSIFVGGPPANTLAAVMPLPEGLSEMTFAGALGNNRFKYTYVDGYCIATEADFIITGEIFPNITKPEGPFGDHLGYYSLTHDFPVMKIHKVFHNVNAIWPFTVVGRPPQEDTQFGALIHSLAGDAIKHEIPGLHEINAVDAAGVHPLLLALGSERYTPYQNKKQPQELLTIANHILGKGQLSLAKYLFITDKEKGVDLSCNQIAEFFIYFLERVDWKRDLHFQTKTTIDTLDYSGTGLNEGSKLVAAATGEVKRKLVNASPIENGELIMNGIISINFPPFTTYEKAEQEMISFCESISDLELDGLMMIVIADDAKFVAKTLNNFLWITFTRSNPATDIYGVNSFFKHKHWGCEGPLIIDARIKSHHAPPLIKDEKVEKKIDQLFENGGSLFRIVN